MLSNESNTGLLVIDFVEFNFNDGIDTVLITFSFWEGQLDALVFDVLNGQFAFEHFLIALHEIVEDETWGNLDIEVSHVIEPTADSRVLSDEVEHLGTSDADVFSGCSLCGVGSLIIEFDQNIMSDLLEINVGLHPWVSSDLINGWSLLAVIAEHFNNKIFKVLTQILSSSFLPVCVEVTLHDQVVEILVFLGLLEWENTLHDNEKNDTYGEHIDLLSIVNFTFLDLWGHICHRTSI